MQDDLMAAGLELMALGMGTVFVFLTLLVVATNFMSNALKDFGIGQDPPAGSGPGSSEVDPGVQQAITLAVEKYRREHGP